MFTKSDPSAQQAAMVIVPVRPAASPAQAPDTTRGLLRRTLGKSSYSRRTLGKSTYSRRTLGRQNPSRRTLGKNTYSRRTLGKNTY